MNIHVCAYVSIMFPTFTFIYGNLLATYSPYFLVIYLLFNYLYHFLLETYIYLYARGTRAGASDWAEASPAPTKHTVRLYVLSLFYSLIS